MRGFESGRKNWRERDEKAWHNRHDSVNFGAADGMGNEWHRAG